MRRCPESNPLGIALRAAAVPSGSSVKGSPIRDGWVIVQWLIVSKSSDPDSRRQKRPDLRQQFLNSLRLPHGQRSFRPSFSSSSLSPCTTRTPRLTLVSEGNPFRRLLIVSKKMCVRQSCACTWGTSFHECVSILARNRTWSSTFAQSRAIPAHSEDMLLSSAPRQGIEPRLAVPKTAVLSVTLARQKQRLAPSGRNENHSVFACLVSCRSSPTRI